MGGFDDSAAFIDLTKPGRFLCRYPLIGTENFANHGETTLDRSLENKPQMPLLLITLTVMSLLWLNIDTRSTIRPWPFESDNVRTSFHSTATNISSVLNDFSSDGETGWPQRFMMQRTIFNNVWNGPIDPANVNQANIQNPVLWFDAWEWRSILYLL
jgi:hypothetical protein